MYIDVCMYICLFKFNTYTYIHIHLFIYIYIVHRMLNSDRLLNTDTSQDPESPFQRTHVHVLNPKAPGRDPREPRDLADGCMVMAVMVVKG